MEEIVNRVTKSPLISLDFDEYIDRSERFYFDLKDCLYQGLILREKDFREFMKSHDWKQYKGKNVGVHCSEDAIIPTWAYMLVATKLEPYVNIMAFGNEMDLEKTLIDKAVERILLQDLKEAKVVIKGCGDIQCRDYAYFELTKHLTGLVSSIMYGEPCSTVPVYKKRK